MSPTIFQHLVYFIIFFTLPLLLSFEAIHGAVDLMIDGHKVDYDGL